MLPIEYGNICEGAADAWAIEHSTSMLIEIMSILKENNIEVPSLDE